MLKRSVVVLAAGVLVLGAFQLLSAPAPQAAPQCVELCPEIVCPPCHEYVPRTCKKCATCKRIPGCKGGGEPIEP